MTLSNTSEVDLWGWIISIQTEASNPTDSQKRVQDKENDFQQVSGLSGWMEMLIENRVFNRIGRFLGYLNFGPCH